MPYVIPWVVFGIETGNLEMSCNCFIAKGGAVNCDTAKDIIADVPQKSRDYIREESKVSFFVTPEACA